MSAWEAHPTFLNSQMTAGLHRRAPPQGSQYAVIVQLVDHRTCLVQVTCSNTIEALNIRMIYPFVLIT